MAKITEAWIRQNKPSTKEIKNTSFRYADLGNIYSYVEFTAELDGEYWSEQVRMKDFYDWVGGNILKFNCS